MSQNTTICPTSGRKRWKCICDNCVADRHPEVHTQSPEAEESQAIVMAKRQFTDCAPTNEDWATATEIKDDPGLLEELRQAILRYAGVDVEVKSAHRIGRYGDPAVCIACTSLGDTRVQLPREMALPVVQLPFELRARLEHAGMHHLGLPSGWLHKDLMVTKRFSRADYRIVGNDREVVLTALAVAQVPQHLVKAIAKRLRANETMREGLLRSGTPFDVDSFNRAAETLSEEFHACSTPMGDAGWVKDALVRRAPARCSIFSDAVVQIGPTVPYDGELDFDRACDLLVNGHKLELRMEGTQLYVNGRLA